MTAGLVAEATRRSGVVWVAPDDQTPARLVWHLWHQDCAYVLTGGREQQLPAVAPGGRALVVVRSKDRRGDRLVQWWADVSSVGPGTDEWLRVLPLLSARRLNAPDGQDQPQRWARECVLLRLTPDGSRAPINDSGYAVPTRTGTPTGTGTPTRTGTPPRTGRVADSGPQAAGEP